MSVHGKQIGIRPGLARPLRLSEQVLELRKDAVSQFEFEALQVFEEGDGSLDDLVWAKTQHEDDLRIGAYVALAELDAARKVWTIHDRGRETRPVWTAVPAQNNVAPEWKRLDTHPGALWRYDREMKGLMAIQPGKFVEQPQWLAIKVDGPTLIRLNLMNDRPCIVTNRLSRHPTSRTLRILSPGVGASPDRKRHLAVRAGGVTKGTSPDHVVKRGTEVLKAIPGDARPIDRQGLPQMQAVYLVAISDDTLWLMPKEIDGLRLQGLSVELSPLELQKDAAERGR